MRKDFVKLIISEDGKELLDEIKSTLKLRTGDEVQIMRDIRYIVIQKTTPFCHSCGSDEDVHTLSNNFTLCKKCLKTMSKVVFDGVSEEEIKSASQL